MDTERSGPRDANAVVVARIDHHVGRGRHMAAGAARAGAPRPVQMVRRPVVLCRRMTLGAHRVAGRAKRPAVRLVTVRAGDAALMHPAREEGAPVVDLVALLAVGVIETRGQQRGAVVVEKRPPWLIAVRDLAAARMTLRADADLDGGTALAAARWHCRWRHRRSRRHPFAHRAPRSGRGPATPCRNPPWPSRRAASPVHGSPRSPR